MIQAPGTKVVTCAQAKTLAAETLASTLLPTLNHGGYRILRAVRFAFWSFHAL